MLDVDRIKHHALKKLVKDGDARKINAEWRTKVKRILSMLNVAVDPREFDLPGFAHHELKHIEKELTRSQSKGIGRITFKWTSPVFDVDMEDDHGR